MKKYILTKKEKKKKVGTSTFLYLREGFRRGLDRLVPIRRLLQRQKREEKSKQAIIMGEKKDSLEDPTKQNQQ